MSAPDSRGKLDRGHNGYWCGTQCAAWSGAFGHLSGRRRQHAGTIRR
jgi:hypothetical protein